MLTIVRAVPSASIAPFTVIFILPALLAASAASARLIAADCVSPVLKGVAIAAPAAAAATPPPLADDPVPPVTVGKVTVGMLLVAETVGTLAVGMFIVGADICETFGKNGTEL